jgi:NAD(P)-dependent dehydrogenase (short-subunit alcohol dehydrogenase family)
LLINSAGALAAPGVTRDRISTTMQINYLAPYALTRLLAPALNAANGRIVTLTSAAHRQADIEPGS